MIRHKIKAVYRSCRGVTGCVHCLDDPDNVRHIIAYGGVEDTEEAERQLYRDHFSEEMDLQNGAYQIKGNHGRIWTMDEWRKSVRHRPIENVLQIGNEAVHLSAKELYEVYHQFFDWRMENFRDIFALVSVSIYVGWIPHVHERYVLFWTDENGVKHTGIDRALAQAGVGLPFDSIEKSRYNNRKMAFDRLCREKWLDLVEEKLKGHPELELDRPDPFFRIKVNLGRDFRLSSGNYRALWNAWGRNHERLRELREKIEAMETELGAVRHEMRAENDDWAALRARALVLKNKIKGYERRLKRMMKKEESINDTISG